METRPCMTRFDGRIWDPWAAHTGASAPAGVCFMEGTHVGAVCEGLYSMGGSPVAAGEQGEKEGVTETRHEPAANPAPYPLHPFERGMKRI